jgi:hypothetical protein
MFCAPGLIFGGSEGVGSRFHVLHSRYSFSAIAWASGPVFSFVAPEHVFGGMEGVGSRFHVLRSWPRFHVSRPRTRFRRFRGRRVPFSCFEFQYTFWAVARASGPVFNLLRSRTRFRQYGGRRVPFSCIASPYSFSAVHTASCPVFRLCAPGLIFGSSEGVGSRFHALRFRTRFRWNRGRRLLLSCFALPYSFSAVLRASGPVFMFCFPVLIFGGSEGVGPHFHALRSWTRFRRFRGCQMSFSRFALPDSFSAVP